ncbi:TetR family transcriptional regulator [Affinibrenneria salicis]|uniref:TetR family transcriptional regulator n=1 Tax=Affinibrenneria salicis TaxID=2590031 RepID=A0A5J5G1G2_9GAMM|nr:TetR/AcrR family transcriptional regulator [Affinibrenneria salicis]KAA9000554.1 TetR family transcriptional regulator [Affinibrenneria salicis]
MSHQPDSGAKPRRGRPPKVDRDFSDTREELIRSGLAVITETGYLAAGIDAVIKNISVPKGSFYHYFSSKQAFGMAVLTAYGAFFAHKLDKFLLDAGQPPLQRIRAFVTHAGQGMAKYDFRRGCLVGNLLQETPLLPEDFPDKLKAILADWENRVASCLQEAQLAGQLSVATPAQQLARIFWSGWEGAVMRAKLFRSIEPLEQFWHYFLHSITATQHLPSEREQQQQREAVTLRSAR